MLNGLSPGSIGNFHFLPIFGDSAAGNGVSLTGEKLGENAVAERFLRAFLPQKLLNRIFHCVHRSGSAGSFLPMSLRRGFDEKAGERKNSGGALEIFPADGPADRRFMNPEGLGGISEQERAERKPPEKVLLDGQDELRDR